MTPLEKFSAVKICAVILIVVIVASIFFVNPGGTVRLQGGSLYENWFEIRQGFLQSVGTFVFTFVAQHTVHLTYNSLHDNVRNMDSWRIVSSISILIATALSLGAGLFVYMTFWKETSSDMFSLYPPLVSIDIAKLLLCVTMMFTYPLPLFSCRELIVISLPARKANEADLLIDDDMPTDDRSDTVVGRRKTWWLLPEDVTQLIRPLHILVTAALWYSSTELAIRAPSLGDVLNLIGCVAGTMIGT